MSKASWRKANGLSRRVSAYFRTPAPNPDKAGWCQAEVDRMTELATQQERVESTAPTKVYRGGSPEVSSTEHISRRGKTIRK